jgi:tetratricopeptide (TPR) repeat protein
MNAKRALLALAVIASAIQPAMATPWAERYKDCLRQAQSNPEAALAAAERWRVEAGGVPARHCQATALWALDRPREAAPLLEQAALDYLSKRNLGDGPLKQSPALGANLLAQAAEAWVAAGDVGKALPLYAQAIGQDPDNLSWRLGRAQARLTANDPAGAVQDLEAAARRAPERADLLILRAYAKRLAGDMAGALADATAAVNRLPADPGARLERGNARHASGDAVGAADDWRAAASLGRNAASQAAQNNLAAIKSQAGETAAPPGSAPPTPVQRP